MHFSLLIPTRTRIERLKVLLTSIVETTYDKTNVEVLIAYDVDDIPTRDFLIATNADGVTQLQLNFPDLIIKAFGRQQSPFINRDYYNWLADKATGDFLWVMGDDLKILSPNWDSIAFDRLEVYLENKPDRVVYGNIDDGTPPPKDQPKFFCCFPIFSKEAVKALGFVFHNEIATWGADFAIYHIYGSSEIDRMCNLFDVKIDHICHHKYGASYRDALSRQIEANYRKLGGGTMVAHCVSNKVPEQIRKLRSVINNGMVREKQV